MIIKHPIFFMAVVFAFAIIVYINYAVAAVDKVPEKSKKCQTVSECFNMVFSFTSNQAAEEVPKKNITTINKSEIIKFGEIPKDAIGYTDLIKSPLTEEQVGSLSDIANDPEPNTSGLKSCDDPNTKANEACQASGAELERRKAEVEAMLAQNQKPSAQKTPSQPPQIPEMPKGSGEDEKSGGEKEGAKPEEGGRVTKDDNDLEQECQKPGKNKPQECKKIQKTDVSDISPLQGGSPVQLVHANNIQTADAGDLYAKEAAAFSDSPHAGMYLSKKVRIVTCDDGKPGCKIPINPVQIRIGAKSPVSPIDFVPPSA